MIMPIFYHLKEWNSMQSWFTISVYLYFISIYYLIGLLVDDKLIKKDTFFKASHKQQYRKLKNAEKSWSTRLFSVTNSRGWENRTPTKGFGDPYHTIWPIPYIQEKVAVGHKFFYIVLSKLHTCLLIVNQTLESILNLRFLVKPSPD